MVVLTIFELALSGTAFAFLYISNWVLGMSLFFWIDRENIVFNSIIVCMFLPIIFIEILFFSVGFWYDLLHWPTLITASYILLKRRRFLNLKYILIITIFITVWIIIISLTGLHYTNYRFEFFNIHWIYVSLGIPINAETSFLILFPFTMVANFGILYLFLRKPSQVTTIFVTK